MFVLGGYLLTKLAIELGRGSNLWIIQQIAVLLLLVKTLKEMYSEPRWRADKGRLVIDINSNFITSPMRIVEVKVVRIDIVRPQDLAEIYVIVSDGSHTIHGYR